jgi:glycolate oxidase iron-sulfur subunit
MSDPAVFTPELLDRCIACGFCLPACPTYALTGSERSSPRGRISLMRAIQTGELLEDDAAVVEESSFCLGCRACEPVCPAGVEYGTLLEEWRDRLWRGRRLSLRLRPLLWLVDRTSRVRAMGRIRRHARVERSDDVERPHLMLGCFERVLYPRVSRSAVALDPQLSVPARQGCCGALHAHNGSLERGRKLARELGEALPGPIVTTAGGCAAHLAGVLGPGRVFELSQWLALRGVPAPAANGAERRLRIGLQDSCHLRNGLGVWREPRELLASIGEYVELPSAGRCCGAAGSYALLRPDDSRAVLETHLDEIEAADLDAIAVVNPGCYRQLQQGIRRRHMHVRVTHLAELLADHTKQRGLER